jgi:hypothetical protein
LDETGLAVVGGNYILSVLDVRSKPHAELCLPQFELLNGVVGPAVGIGKRYPVVFSMWLKI